MLSSSRGLPDAAAQVIHGTLTSEAVLVCGSLPDVKLVGLPAPQCSTQECGGAPALPAG